MLETAGRKNGKCKIFHLKIKWLNICSLFSQTNVKTTIRIICGKPYPLIQKQQDHPMHFSGPVGEIQWLQHNTTLISPFPISNHKKSRQGKQLPTHAWFSLAVTTGWDMQPLHWIHHSADYHRSAGAAWRLGGLLVNHTDTLFQPKGGQSLSQPTDP